MLSFLVDLCTANNTVAIVMTGPIAKEISDEFDVDPRTIGISAGYVYIRWTGADPLRRSASVCGSSHRSDSV